MHICIMCNIHIIYYVLDTDKSYHVVYALFRYMLCITYILYIIYSIHMYIIYYIYDTYIYIYLIQMCIIYYIQMHMGGCGEFSVSHESRWGVEGLALGLPFREYRKYNMEGQKH